MLEKKNKSMHVMYSKTNKKTKKKMEGNISDMEISKPSHHCLPIRDGGYDFIVWACLK